MDGFNEKIVPTETFFVFVDSRYRDTSVHISPSQYIVDFDNVFKNVISVDLVHAMYGKTNTNEEKYVNVHIEELNPNITSHINHSKGAFTQIPFYDPKDDVYEYSKTVYQSIRRFEKPLMKLSKLSITFLDKDGRLFPITDHILRFEVTCFKLNENTEEWDNFRLVSNSVRATEPVIKKDPYVLLGLQQGQFNLEMLVVAFRNKSKTLRTNGYNKGAYDELKNAFSQLAATLKQPFTK
jgi:hypothetical protein